MQISAPLNHDPVPALQRIEVASSLQIPSFHIVGLPNPEVAEARERIRAAIEASGIEFPRRRLVLNLSPSSIRKRGTGIDLAMALAILNSKSKSKSNENFQVVAWGELGLDGTVKASGQITRAVFSTWQGEGNVLFVPATELEPALNAIRQIKRSEIFSTAPPIVIPSSDLKSTWEILLKLRQRKAPILQSEFSAAGESSPVDLRPEIPALLPLRPYLERVIALSAAGNHHLLLLGPRGTGKTHATEWLIALQPAPEPQIILNNLLIAELRTNEKLSTCQGPPVRRVSVQSRPAALMGSATAGAIRPGEYSLAHGGLLVADEFLEWPRDSRETLRGPLESGRVLLTRTLGSAELPARFTLVANGNLCPCGGWPPELPAPAGAQGLGSSNFRCKCTLKNRSTYLTRLSGPVLDRLDIVSLVLPETSKSAPKYSVNSQERKQELREKVQAAADFAKMNWGAPAGQLSAAQVETFISANPAWLKWNAQAKSQTHSAQSLRSRHKIARVALTLAAWEQKASPDLTHFTEAECYRPEALGLFS